jgi:hypothetical protein
MENSIDILISFDTTGSMYPCLTQVRNNVNALVTRLFKDIPEIRIGIIAHGDYCDADTSYVIKMLDISDDSKRITSFINNVSRTGGGDSPECYELVLHTARTANWTSGRSKVLIMIGDDVPHGQHEKQNTKKLDWRNELKLLLEAGINVYAVQALGRYHATPFYREVAETTGGFHLKLDQFSQIRDLIMAVCYKQYGDEYVERFETELVNKKQMNRSVDAMIGVLLNRTTSTGKPRSSRYKEVADGLHPVHPSRFQVLKVDRDVPIKDFVLENGATFKQGRGFYEFTKRVTVQGYKEIILMDTETGDLFSGKEARKIAGIPEGTATISPNDSRLENYICFIQSTSNNRKLIAGTSFLYEVEDYEK